jgi:lantibiotic biosynthesis protein
LLASVAADGTHDAISRPLAHTIAIDVGRRLSCAGVVDATLAEARSRPESRLAHWRDGGLWQGYSGLGLLCAALEAIDVQGGWDRMGFEFLGRAVKGIEARRNPAGQTGLAGLAGAAAALSHGGTRYPTLLGKLEAAIAQMARAQTASILHARPHGVGAAMFDVIAGLSGTGRYLLARGASRPLEQVLRALVYLSEEDPAGIPHWHTDPRYSTPSLLRGFPDGHINLGLAHGIPGPLALLSIATAHGVEVADQRQAIARTANWLARTHFNDQWGVQFSIATPLGATRPNGTSAPARAAWCYGSPGLARALWLAGVALDCAEYRDLAVAAMTAVYRRPVAARGIDSPTLCHGVAGLLQITARFARDCREPVFADAVNDLTTQLVDAYEAESRFGYRNVEPPDTGIDHPGFLDGAAGVAAVLASVATAAEPEWDRVLLLS